MRSMCLVVVVAACATVDGAAQSAPQPKPVLVELFTSEGCSDCPPADRLLKALDEKQPVADVHAIVLSEHVTYWNHDGWTDPFSLDQMTERQQDYVTRFRLNSSYTPQMVVDGSIQFVGNDARALQAALEKAAAQPKEDVTIADAQWKNGGVEFAVHAAPSKPKTRLFAVLAASETQARVTAGENSGRTLEHSAVVRVMKPFGAESGDGRSLRLAAGPLAHKDEVNGSVRLVVFLVDEKTGYVLGSAEQTLTRQ